MKSAMMIGVMGALFTGMFIGSQAAIGSRIGALIGPIRTGLYTNALGGGIAIILVIITIFFPVKEEGLVTPQSIGWLTFSGLLGIFIIIGVSFSLQKIGITAGIGTLLLGQLIISTLVDTLGIGGGEPIPLTATRISGMVLLLFSVYLLAPKK